MQTFGRIWNSHAVMLALFIACLILPNALPSSPGDGLICIAPVAMNGVVAIGWIASGVATVGLISVGVGSVGIVSIGVGSIGIVAFGPCAIGLRSYGVLSIGWWAFGVAAYGRIAGGLAAMGRYAIGMKARGKYIISPERQDSEAVAIFSKHIPESWKAWMHEAPQRNAAMRATERSV
jgi:hypothetical protein